MNDFRNLLISGHNIALASLCITLLSVVIYCLYQLSMRSIRRCKQGFIINKQIKFSSKRIAYIAIMVAVSVSTTTVISLTLPITVFPPIRVAFEGIMIKITGMIFGPLIGLTVGLITEILTLMFVPSYIHIAYLIVAFSFGFWSGMTSYAFKWTGKKNLITLSLISGFLIISAAVMYWIMKGIAANGESATIFGIKIAASFYPNLFLIMIGATLLLIYSLTFFLYYKKKEKWLNTVLPIILLCVITEILATVLVAAWGDYQLFGLNSSGDNENGFITMVVVRIIQIPIKITFNVAVLTTVYTVLRPLIKVR